MAMKVNISELKARLSACLDMVRKGGTLVVLDRRTPIARIVPFSDPGGRLAVSEPRYGPARIDGVKGIRLRRPVDVGRMLDESRADR